MVPETYTLSTVIDERVLNNITASETISTQSSGALFTQLSNGKLPLRSTTAGRQSRETHYCPFEFAKNSPARYFWDKLLCFMSLENHLEAKVAVILLGLRYENLHFNIPISN